MVAVMACLALTVYAQGQNTSTESDQSSSSDYKDTWNTPYITDDMTVDPEQNRSWRMGDYKFPARPKHSWEFGLHLGHFIIDGDVDRDMLGGYGLGLHLRKAVNYTFSIRGSVFYGMAMGLEKQPARHRNNTGTNGIGGGLVEQPVFDMLDPMRGGPGEWFPAYQTTYISTDIAAIFNLGNLLFHRERNKWNLYFGLGMGLNTHEARLDILDSNGLPYDGVRQLIGWTPEEFDTKAGRDRIASELRELYDGDYETEAYKKAGIFRIGDEMNLHFVIIPSIGISRKLSKRINLSLEHQAFISDTDYLDGIKFRTSVDQSNNIDVGHYTSMRIGINLGNFKEVTEPLYWMNPIDQALSDIAQLKQEDKLELADEDNDGVIDLLDQELDTPEDCPVDTRGIILDSDGDGIVDCEDREPYSRPGCPVDEFGIAECSDLAGMDEEQLKRMLRESLQGSNVDEFTADTDTGELKWPGEFTTNSDGSESYTVYEDDGTKSTSTRRLDGSLITEKIYSDGSLARVTKDENGQLNAVREDANGVVTRSKQLADGTVESITEYPDGAVTTSTRDNEGRLESETQYADGSNLLVIREADGSIISDREELDGTVTTSSQLADGTVKSQTRYADGAKETFYKDSEGLVRTTRMDPDGTIVTTENKTNGDWVRTIERPLDHTTVITKSADGTLTSLTNKDDGAFTRITEKPDGEIIKEEVAADGLMTSIKQRPDGSQRIIQSNDEGILSDTELGADEAKSLLGIEVFETPASPELPEAPDVLDIPFNPEFPDRSEAPVAEKTSRSGNIINGGCGDWFLPMIHFDLNRYKIKSQYFSHLHNVAQVMRKCPEVCVVAQGHTDTRHSNDYNTLLSYRRAKAAVDYLVEKYDIERARIKLMYGGEESPMVLSASTEAHHFMNRRVEFRTCEAGDKDMPAPEGLIKSAEAKAQTDGFQKGNKASGY